MRTISFKFFNAICITLFLIFLAFLLSISLVSCEKGKNEKAENLCPVVAESAVPQAVKDSFGVRYPSTTVNTWFYKDSSSYCAFFITAASIEKLAQFSSNGNFISEEIETNQDGQHEDNDSTATGPKATTGCECETHKEDH